MIQIVLFSCLLFPFTWALSRGSMRITPTPVWELNNWWPGPRIARLPSGPTANLIIDDIIDDADLIQVERVLCVVDGRAVLHATSSRIVPTNGSSVWTCDLSFLSFGGLHWVAAYAIPSSGSGGNPTLINEPVLLTWEGPTNSNAAAIGIAVNQLATHNAVMKNATPPHTASLGVYYTTYLNPLTQLYQNITRDFGWTRTLETVLQDENLHLADSVWKTGSTAASPEWKNYSATCDLMHQEPALGMYCLYRKRGNESFGPIPDCPETSTVLQAHAAELSAAGFDFVAPDATNWDGDPREATPPPISAVPGGSDFYQLRPMEIIAEEFAAARLAGRSTPQLSVFAMVNTGGALWRWYMSEFFNNETLLALDLIFRDNTTGKKVFIAADLGNRTDYATVTAIATNEGRNDTVVPLMWFAPNASGAWEASGRLAYFSRCIGVHQDTGVVDFSTDAWIDGHTPCAHRKTRSSPVGSSWTVSTGLSIDSVPMGAVRFNGLLTKKQWYDVFADPEPTDLIFVPSFNEFGSRAYSLPGLVGTNNPAFFSSGLSDDDPDRFVLFEDGFGAQRSRSIEPSVEDGGRIYETFASCVRVYRLQAALGIVSNGTGCNVVGEECCTVREDESFVHAWSLDSSSSSSLPLDSLITSDRTELVTLLSKGWSQVCVPTIFGRGPTATCVDGTLPFQGVAGIDKASRGPFILRSNASIGLTGNVPLVRCVQTSTGLHFIANNTDCAPGEGMNAEFVLGFGASSRSSLFARSVRRCRRRTSTKSWYTTINVACLTGDEDDGILLYAV